MTTPFHEYPKAIGDQLALNAEHEAEIRAALETPKPAVRRGRKADPADDAEKD